MARTTTVAILLVALAVIPALVLPAVGAQKTVLYEHFTASW